MTNDSLSNSRKNIKDLDDWTLIKIFDYLPFHDKIRLERVCKRWKSLVGKSWATTKSIEIYGIEFCKPSNQGSSIHRGRIEYEDDNKVMTSSRGSVRSSDWIIEFSHNFTDSTRRLSSIFQQAKALHYLNIQVRPDGDWWVESWRYLPINSVEVIEFRITEENKLICQNPDIVLEVLPSCEKLHTIAIHFLARETSQQKLIDAIGQCQAIKNLVIANIDQNDKAIDYSSLSNLLRLVSLSLSYSNLNDAGLAEIIESCQDLKCLNLTGCYSSDITDTLFTHISQLPKLETLNISGMKQITGAGFSTMPELKVLNCSHSGVDSKRLRGLIEFCPKLEKIDASGCENVYRDLFEFFKKKNVELIY